MAKQDPGEMAHNMQKTRRHQTGADIRVFAYDRDTSHTTKEKKERGSNSQAGLLVGIVPTGCGGCGCSGYRSWADIIGSFPNGATSETET